MYQEKNKFLTFASKDVRNFPGFLKNKKLAVFFKTVDNYS